MSVFAALSSTFFQLAHSMRFEASPRAHEAGGRARAGPPTAALEPLGA